MNILNKINEMEDVSKGLTKMEWNVTGFNTKEPNWETDDKNAFLIYQ